MHHLATLSQRQITLLIGADARRDAMLELTAVLALRGRVRVIDGAGQSSSNSFDPYRVARAIRKRTHRLDEVFSRVTIARAFTCYQAITLLEQTPATTRPHLVCDLMATFYDDAMTYNESYRLLHVAICELHRLSRRAPVVVSARPAPHRERSGLLRLLKESADHVILPGAAKAEEMLAFGKRVPLWEPV
jgi:hypothetical protein